ncbi:Ca-dependent carbohydrate-binding module xylan-binding [Arboricoccus pini]|uniref:Ca-dependent carbohydrate-binding module xylan-binding n=1 Tax=Arboricoccus pini TaxID=1963835 RepID=A0A212RS23_9PROT|nr:carbohydrate-binding domain-containing protein [Arboricoccus pini]SNB75461.1 Ca-dependent carbohydrate-binding module xylan-binding [Arboricoccus pini]
MSTTVAKMKVLGVGDASFIVNLSQDKYLDDAKFIIKVDGVTIDGVQTVSAQHGKDEVEQFVIRGDWRSGIHHVDITFLNDLYRPSTDDDRNLYLDSYEYKDENFDLNVRQGRPGTMSFDVQTQTSSSSRSSDGQLVLWMSEDAYLGDAKFNLYIDGEKIGDSYTVTSSHSKGDLQKIVINGDFGSGEHKIGIEFINDLYDHESGKDRNLYLHSAEYDGKTYQVSTEMLNYQTKSFTIENSGAGTTTSGDSGGKLTLWMSEDSFQGDAQFTVYVDGKKFGDTYTVTSSHAKGDLQRFDISGNLGSGEHKIDVNFINDAVGRNSSQDRNLYFQSAEYDGKVYDVSANMYYNQTKSFTVSSSDSADSYNLKSIRAADFHDLIGVNQHANYLDTAYGDKAAFVNALEYLGIGYIRTTASDGDMPFLKTLAAHGIDFDVIVDNNVNKWSDQLANMHELAPHIRTIEGPNEVNFWPVSFNGASGVSGAIATQKAIFEAINNASDLHDIPVVSFSVSASDSSAFKPYANSYEDLGNAHVYFGSTAPADVLAEYGRMPSDSMDDGKNTLITETGYNTGSGSMGVSESVQAKYTLDLVMDVAKQGFAGAILYELADLFDRPGEEGSNWGLFDSDWKAKPAAVGLHNLMTILEDSGSTAASFTTDTFSYDLKGLPQSGNTVVMEKSNGAHDIAVWAEPSLWNSTSRTEIKAATSTVEVDLQHSYGTVKVYDPLISADAINTYHNVDHVQIGVSDHPMIVEVA